LFLVKEVGRPKCLLLLSLFADQRDIPLVKNQDFIIDSNPCPWAQLQWLITITCAAIRAPFSLTVGSTQLLQHLGLARGRGRGRAGQNGTGGGGGG